MRALRVVRRIDMREIAAQRSHDFARAHAAARAHRRRRATRRLRSNQRARQQRRHAEHAGVRAGDGACGAARHAAQSASRCSASAPADRSARSARRRNAHRAKSTPARSEAAMPVSASRCAACARRARPAPLRCVRRRGRARRRNRGLGRQHASRDAAQQRFAVDVDELLGPPESRRCASREHDGAVRAVIASDTRDRRASRSVSRRTSVVCASCVR